MKAFLFILLVLFGAIANAAEGEPWFDTDQPLCDDQALMAMFFGRTIGATRLDELSTKLGCHPVENVVGWIDRPAWAGRYSYAFCEPVPDKPGYVHACTYSAQFESNDKLGL